MPSQPDDTTTTTDDKPDRSTSDSESDTDSSASQQVESEPDERVSIDIATAQQEARDAAQRLLDHDFEAVIEVSAEDDGGWRVLVEMVERHAVPDTQDIIGRYAIELDKAGSVSGYELRERYQRGDMKKEL